MTREEMDLGPDVPDEDALAQECEWRDQAVRRDELLARGLKQFRQRVNREVAARPPQHYVTRWHWWLATEGEQA